MPRVVAKKAMACLYLLRSLSSFNENLPKSWLSRNTSILSGSGKRKSCAITSYNLNRPASEPSLLLHSSMKALAEVNAKSKSITVFNFVSLSLILLLRCHQAEAVPLGYQASPTILKSGYCSSTSSHHSVMKS